MYVPEHLVRQAYVEGSFRNIRKDSRVIGVELRFRNTLGPGAIGGILRFRVGGKSSLLIG